MFLGCVILKEYFLRGSSKVYSLYKVCITLHKKTRKNGPPGYKPSPKLPLQWWIQGRGPGGPDPPRPLFFRPNLGPKGLKKFFWTPPPPPPAYLRVWITPLLISRSGSATALLHFEAYLKISKCKKYFVSNHFFYSSYIAP